MALFKTKNPISEKGKARAAHRDWIAFVKTFAIDLIPRKDRGWAADRVLRERAKLAKA